MKATIQANIFKNLIDNAKRFVRKDGDFSFICLDIDSENKEIKATALDGYTVSIETAKIWETDSSFRCFVKPFIPIITKNDELVGLELVENKCYVSVGESITGYVQPNDAFAGMEENILKLATEEPKAVIFCDAKLLKRAMESVNTICLKRDVVKIELREEPQPIVIRYGFKRENTKYVLPFRKPTQE